jgi:hypothetical protein
MCTTIRKMEERMHMSFTTGQIFGCVHPYASTHRDYGLSIGKGAES